MREASEELVDRLFEARKNHRLPTGVRPLAQSFSQHALSLLFPHFAAGVAGTKHAVRSEVAQVEATLEQIADAISVTEAIPGQLIERFVARLASVHQMLCEDAGAIYAGDPAAKSIDEVILTYPGFYALATFRVAHVLQDLGLPLLPRLLTELAHEKTGIDIHPGANIGRRFCIDHGTGVVIGETTTIGAGVKLYQGVTLGALTVEKTLAGNKRHPTIEDEVVVYAGATILGGKTVVGHHSIVAGNAFLTASVPPHSAVSRTGDVRPRRADFSVEEFDFVI